MITTNFIYLKKNVYNYKKKLLKKIFNKNKLLSSFKFLD